VRQFGGLSVDSTMSYAVRDFFLNGGSQALIVRIENGATRARIELDTGTVDDLILDAANPGNWGNALRAGIDYNTKEPQPDLFNLTVAEVDSNGQTVATEKFFNVSNLETDPRYLPRVLAQGSLLVAVREDATGTPEVPAARPLETFGTGSPPEIELTAAVVGSGADGNVPGNADYEGSSDTKTGLFALDKADLFNLLCITPPSRTTDTASSVYQAAVQYCVSRRAFLIVDPPRAWGERPETAAANARAGLSGLGLAGNAARNAALYFPMVKEVDLLRDNQVDDFVPCGVIAGVMARTDGQRGVWKAPAGLEAALNGIQGLQVNLSDQENGVLNPLGINCLRSFPVNGRVVWGARTLRGADQLGDEYKYVPVRRLALFLEESLYRGTQFAVFEPNDEPLWAQLRLAIGAFMQTLFRQGAFQGRTPREAYLVKVDKETTTQNDINLGIVNILVGFAPLKPAEFVIIKIQQLAGQIQV